MCICNRTPTCTNLSYTNDNDSDGWTDTGDLGCFGDEYGESEGSGFEATHECNDGTDNWNGCRGFGGLFQPDIAESNVERSLSVFVFVKCSNALSTLNVGVAAFGGSNRSLAY